MLPLMLRYSRNHHRGRACPGLPLSLLIILLFSVCLIFGMTTPAHANRPGLIYSFRAPDLDSAFITDTDSGALNREFQPGRSLVAGRILHYEWNGETYVRVPVLRVVAATIDRSGAALRKMSAVPDASGLFILPHTIASSGETITISEWETESRLVRRASSDRLFAAVTGTIPNNLYGFIWMGEVAFRAHVNTAIYTVARPVPGLIWNYRLNRPSRNSPYRWQPTVARQAVPYATLIDSVDNRWAVVLSHLSGIHDSTNVERRTLTADQIDAYHILREREQQADSGVVRSLRQTLRVLATLGDRNPEGAFDALAKGAEFIAQAFSIFHAIFQVDGSPGRRGPAQH